MTKLEFSGNEQVEVIKYSEFSLFLMKMKTWKVSSHHSCCKLMYNIPVINMSLTKYLSESKQINLGSCGWQPVTGGSRGGEQTVQEASCDRGWQGGCHQVPFPLSLCISRVSAGWSGTTGPLLPTFSQLSHESQQKDKICESHTVQVRHTSATCFSIQWWALVLHLKSDTSRWFAGPQCAWADRMWFWI